MGGFSLTSDVCATAGVAITAAMPRTPSNATIAPIRLFMIVFPFALQPGFDPASWARVSVCRPGPNSAEINGNWLVRELPAAFGVPDWGSAACREQVLGRAAEQKRRKSSFFLITCRGGPQRRRRVIQ